MLTRNESGLVVPSRVLALFVSVLAIAALIFIANRPDPGPDKTAAVGKKATPTPTPTATPTPTPTATPQPPKIKRGQTYVEIFNNSRVKGLAGSTAAKAKLAGWNVVGTDNWYGTVDGSTVYFPPGMKPAGQALATDLGIKNTKAAIAPMRLDRLTVVLTTDYRG